MSGGSTTQSSGTSTSVNQIPQWMSDAGQQNYAFAQQVAEQPLQQYAGQMVADVAPQTQQAWDVAANSGNVGADQFNGATAGYLGALAAQPGQVSAGGPTMQVDAGGPTMQVTDPGNANAVRAGQIGNTNLDRYMNPYTQDVINATMPIMQQQNALSQNQQANAANSSNAFGGSRQGIQQGVAQAQGAQNIGQMLAGLNSANFTQAQAAATGDINRSLQAQTTNQASQQTDLARALQAQTSNQGANAADLNRSLSAQTSNQGANAADLQRSLTAQQSNQTADQAKINSDIMASQGLTNTGDSMNKSNVANYGMLSSAGAGQSMQAQNQINAQMAKFNQAFNYPQQQLGTLLSALGMTPHDTSTSSQQTSQQTTPTDWASLISGGLKDASSIYGMTQSDRSTKTDITKLGKDPKTGLEMHAFRYKGDPKSYPKVVGPMAQDVEKAFPGSTEEVGEKGKLAIKGYAAGTANVQSNADPSWAPEFDVRAGDYPGLSVKQQAELERSLAAVHGVRGYAAGTPSVAAFIPPSSPLVAKGLSAMSAFRPPVKLPRGATMPKMQKFAAGTSNVQQDYASEGWEAPESRAPYNRVEKPSIRSDAEGTSRYLQRQIGPNVFSRPGDYTPPPYNYARGVASVPGFGSTDTVPAMLTPGEAVLTPGAAKHVGRGNISALNAMMPPMRGQATSMPRAGARGIQGALANTKLRPKIAGALSG